ncbi:MAG TPA: hypothetical protein VFO10_12455 [Oligoflexus sp.]|uniref:hypothetical protein n=1 Tax=Oligoflexus sp. TaxID=1971216 RepID=UPI002D7E269F|nr:hypothetical protein [Oligoflexus sp.]HET9238061.1 hypothetical protein [Oligoflexus sp.]
MQESAIDEFTLSAELLNLAPDEKAGLLTVTWRSRNTYKCQLTLGDGQSYPDRLPNDEIAGISVSVSTFVVLTCNDAQGNEVRAEKSIKLTRDPSNKLAILAFEAKPNNVVLAPSENEGTVQLKWQSQLASSCTLERLTPYSAMKVDVQGRDLPFQVWESTQLVLTCKDSTGSVQKTIGIKVGRSPGPEPKILDLAITPNPLFIFRDDGPQPITISWKTEGLNTCGLALKNESGNVEYLRGLDASGTNESFRINTTSDVTLSCQGPAGQDISKTIQAQVTTLDRPEKCEASERNLYFIRTLDDNATRFFSSQADRDKAFEDMQNLPICRDGNCVKEDKTHFTIKLNDKEAFVYGMNEKTLRDQHMATLQSSGFCSRPTRVSADAFYITIDGKNAFYIADNKERLNRLLEMFQKNLPSSKKCGVTSSYLTLDGRDVFYESDDSKRWNAFMSLEESGFCSVPTRVGANRSYITIDGRDVFYESDDAKRLQWMLTLSKKNILPEGSKCGANRSYISISGRDVFYESDDHKRSAILERLAVSGYCTSASPISANRSYITIDGRDVFYESDDGARLNWMLSLFQAGLFPAGTRCNANRSYITLDGRDVFYESDDRKRAQTLSVLFASGFCMGASELSANRSSLTLGGRDVFSFNDDDERLTRLMEGFKAGLGKPQSRCAANRSFVTLDKKDAFQASDDADRFQMLVKLEKSGFCSRPSRFGATTSAVTIDGRPVYIIADHEARLEKLIALFQGESE